VTDRHRLHGAGERRPLDARNALDPGTAAPDVEGRGGRDGWRFITLTATLSAIPAIPVAGLALLAGVDRFTSAARALTNLIGNAVATVVVARWDGALDMERARIVLNGRVDDTRDEVLPDPAEPKPVFAAPAYVGSERS